MSGAVGDVGGRGGDGSARRRFRGLVFRVHTWLGLHLCLVFALIFLTGTTLVFSPELNIGGRFDLYIAPPGKEAPRASPGELYDRVREAHPEAAITLISGAPRPWLGRPVMLFVPGEGRKVVWVHPVDGREIGTQIARKMNLNSFFRSLHDALLVPVQPARIAVTLLSLALLTMVTTGLITYRRFWRGYFRRPPPGMDARGRNGVLHRTVAVWVLPFLLVIGLTGVVYLLKEVGLHGELPQRPAMSERAARLPDGFRGDDLERIVGIAENAVPTLRPDSLSIPGTRAEPFRIGGQDSALPPLLRFSTVIIDPVTEEVAQVRRAVDGNLMARILPIAQGLHYGNFGGFLTLGLWVLFGLASSFLLLTGARIHALRTLKERQVAGWPVDIPQGTIRVLWQGLGIFRWAYVLAFLAMGASLARTLLF